MNEVKVTRRYLLNIGFLIALLYFSPGAPRAQEPSGSAQPLPSTGMTGTDLNSKCVECHEYGENHHPLGIVPSHPSDYPFPLYNGKIVCLTCHTEDHLGGGLNLLRYGPYVDRREICFKCHAEWKCAKIDPHIMMDDRGNILSVNGRPVCLFCHSAKLNPAAHRTGDVLLRADVAFLCWRCHTPMADQKFFNDHFLATPSMEIRRFMEKQEQGLRVIIPLGPRGRLTCSTCHNPHQKGVIADGPSASGAGAPHRLRLPVDKICIACHNII